MGFFSSRKAEPTPLPASHESSVKVIRSRFYGKNRNYSAAPLPNPSAPFLPPPLPVHREATAPNQSASAPGRQVSANALTMSLAERLNDLATANADGLLDDEEYRLLRQNLFERFATSTDTPIESPVVPISATSEPREFYYKRRPSVDSQRSIATAVSSLFRRATGRSSSLASPSPSASGSVGDSVFSLQQQLSPTPDNASLYSRPSVTSRTQYSPSHTRTISRQPSDDSIMSTSQAGSVSGSVTSDIRNIMARNRVPGGGHYASSISSRATTRSAKPPSSFHLRQTTSSPRIPPRTHEEDENEEHPKSAAELSAEIEHVESEGRKLLDAFNGLELTALTKSRGVGPVSSSDCNARRLSIYSDSVSHSLLGSAYTLIPDRASSMRKTTNGHIHTLPLVSQPVNLKRKPSVVNSIAGSLKSSTSDLRSGFLSSAPPSLHSSRSSPNLPSMPSPSPPVPALPISASSPGATSVKKRPSILRTHRQPNYPSINISRGPALFTEPRPSPLARRTGMKAPAAGAGDPVLHALETELADIRRRKADVATRYERRLDFLRAKLKSAEIRERLIKK
ncbi:hypothetical protein K439DRAFT_1660643 [Ramaria rubella]|nr:hypothetical protein K439DRAFT_1660643 [Ramaria rubella]